MHIIPYLFILLLLCGCRSHKQPGEEVAVDSLYSSVCTHLRTDVTLNTSDSISSSVAYGRVDFNDGQGHIDIHSDGTVSISGAKSIITTLYSSDSHSITSLSHVDSVDSRSEMKSYSEMSVKKFEPIQKSGSYRVIIMLFLLFAIIMAFLIYRSFFRNSRT